MKRLLDSLDQLEFRPDRSTLTELLERRTEWRAKLDEFTRSVLAAGFDRSALGRDWVRFYAQTRPRLTGRVVTVGENGKFASLAEAAPDLAPGDVLLLGAGTFTLPRSREGLRDILILGLGAEHTELRGQLERADRIQIDSVKVNCNDDPFLDLRRGGSVHLRRCEVGHYNSGAGGSNAIYGASNTVLLIEDCVFDGRQGRSAGPNSFGDALDLRGQYALYARNTEFVDNEEILRATGLSVFDGCSSSSRAMKERGFGIMPYPGGLVLLRDNRARVHQPARAKSFALASDSPRFVEHAFHGRSDLARDEALHVQALGVTRNPAYWIPLLAHDHADVRQLAMARLGILLRDLLPDPTAKLDPTPGLTAERRAGLIRELHVAQRLSWWSEHRDQLAWSAEQRRYVKTPR